jgi:hypothetical protein
MRRALTIDKRIHGCYDCDQLDRCAISQVGLYIHEVPTPCESMCILERSKCFHMPNRQLNTSAGAITKYN